MEESFPTARFYIEIDGMNRAVFTEAEGLQIEVDVTEYEEGGNNGFVHRLPGRTRISNLTLKRGLVQSNQLFKWQVEISQGKVTRRNISVVMYDPAGTEMIRWNLIKAYPVRWIGPAFRVSEQVTGIETLELAHAGLELG
ncbi:MAG: phage tail protein [Thermomicrobia bacterium]|nr:phage tail protein [Thermomicrobia bacterium]